MANKGKIPPVKIEFGKNNKVIIQVLYNQELMKIKMFSRRRWNPEEKYWEVPYSEDLIAKLKAFFSENLAVDLYLYLIPLDKELSIREYSRKTIKSYIRVNRDFLIFTGKKLGEIENKDVKEYLYYVINRKKVATFTLNVIINALKFYYGKVLKKDFTFEIKCPKKIRNYQLGGGRNITTSRGMHIHSTADIPINCKNICNVDMSELSEITRSFNKINYSIRK